MQQRTAGPADIARGFRSCRVVDLRCRLHVTKDIARFVSPLLAATLLSVPLPAMARGEEFRRLNAIDIRAFAVGKDVSDEHHTVEYHRRDGVLIVTDFATGDAMERGRWTIANDQLCNTYAASTQPECFQIWRSGNAVSFRLREQGRPPLAYVGEHKGR
jgi:hypothetical protein